MSGTMNIENYNKLKDSLLVFTNMHDDDDDWKESGVDHCANQDPVTTKIVGAKTHLTHPMLRARVLFRI